MNRLVNINNNQASARHAPRVKRVGEHIPLYSFLDYPQ